jgi:hypothetical protein
LLPSFSEELQGYNEVRIRNPNEYDVCAGLRCGDKGLDFLVDAQGVASVYAPNGRYDIFFTRSSEPYALYQGDSFSLQDNGVEIQLVQVTGGNYDVRRIR